MAVPPGTHFGPYEILSPVGAGGMGEVYRARDPRLGRDVAIKILPANYADNADRLRRFEQEARAASALNHPNILTIYDIGEHEAGPYVVSELLEGDTLRDRMGESPMPQRKVVEYALQIANGLAAAHDKGIVHRDLKPENIFITRDSRVKILDFGLAKLTAPIEPETAGEAKTLRVDTEPGLIIGTAGYMSPEQVRGLAPDHRSDIFAFGAVLYEMLAGKRAFKGESKLDTMSAILKEDPSDIIDSNRRIGPGLDRIVRHCLEKNPSERFNSARDLAFAIEALSGSGGTEPAQRVEKALHASQRVKRREMLAWAVVAIATVVIAVLLLILYSRARDTQAPEAARFLVYPPDKTIFQGGGDFVSPDGRRLLFTATGADGRRILWLRTIDSLTAQTLPGTEDASQPFWSPDSRFVGFFAGGKLKKIEVLGGSVQVLAEAQANRGGTWSSDGVIVFSPTVADGLFRVAANGGSATQITRLDTAKFQTSHCWPYFLPDGKHFLYLARNSQRQNSAIYVGSIDSEEAKLVVNSDAGAIYAEPGYLFFVSGRALMVQPFDADNAKLSGEPVPVVEQIGYSATTARAFFSVSSNGVLAYRGNVPLNGQLTWYDRAGKQLEKAGAPGDFLGFSLSPDQKRVVVSRLEVENGSYDLWMIELGRGTSSRFTFDQANETFPVWSRDGNRIVFASNKFGPTDLFQKNSNGAGGDELVFKSTNLKAPNDWSVDGTILYNEFDPKTNSDLWVLPPGTTPQPAAVMQTTFGETNGRFSPDGKWIAYESNESGPGQIYVQGFPTGGKTQVSTLGGFQPRWRGDGKELFYIGPDKKLMVVEIKFEAGGIQAGTPRPLLDLRIGNLPGSPYYDVSSDGQRFLISVLGEESAPTPMNVVMNWTAGLKK